MIRKGIRFVVFRYSHHSPHSGYSRLAEYGVKHLNGELIKVKDPLPRFIIRERILWRLARGTPGYDRTAMAAELKVILRMLTQRNLIYHFLYGEINYHYSGQFTNYNQNKIVATFHLPPDGLRQAIQIEGHLKKLSGIICVGRSQQEFFSNIVNQDRIFFVPLGVDIQYYTPPSSFDERDPNLCLVVGENYRDYPTLRGVIELVSYIRPQIRFVIVTQQRNFQLIGKHPNIEYRSGIPEKEFLNLYHKAALMVMPLTDATANNAVLESMACGLPLVISDVGSIRDYVTEDCAALIQPFNARKMAEAVIELLDECEKRRKMALKCREQAEKFSWVEVMKQLNSVYEKIC